LRVNPNNTLKQVLMEKNAGVCCVCKKRGMGVNFHHIDGNNANTTEENMAVLCVRDHDFHHRPNSYRMLQHLELGADEIRTFKQSWEAFVMEAVKPNPSVFAVINLFGTESSIHSMKLIFQWESGKIECERLYHLHSGSMQQWIDWAFQEVEWFSKTMKVFVIEKVFEVEHCPCCSTSYSNTLDENVAKRFNSASWDKESICSVYINPLQPSLAIIISLRENILFEGSLHLCGDSLHFHCSSFDERKLINKQKSIREQAVDIVNKVITEWEPKHIFIGTGDQDTPHMIPNIDLPELWEFGFSKKKKVSVKIKRKTPQFKVQ